MIRFEYWYPGDATTTPAEARTASEAEQIVERAGASAYRWGGETIRKLEGEWVVTGTGLLQQTAKGYPYHVRVTYADGTDWTGPENYTYRISTRREAERIALQNLEVSGPHAALYEVWVGGEQWAVAAWQGRGYGRRPVLAQIR